MITKATLIKQYGKETKEVEVPSWGGTVEIRKLTIKEENKVRAMLMNNATAKEMMDQKIQISVSLLNDSNMLAVSYALVNPKMSVEDINELPSDAIEGINEIKKALDEWGTPKKSKAGNSSSL